MLMLAVLGTGNVSVYVVLNRQATVNPKNDPTQLVPSAGASMQFHLLPHVAQYTMYKRKYCYGEKIDLEILTDSHILDLPVNRKKWFLL
jgi:hypothetical protein